MTLKLKMSLKNQTIGENAGQIWQLISELDEI